MINSPSVANGVEKKANRQVKTAIEELLQILDSVGNGDWVPQKIQEVSLDNEKEMKAIGLRIRHRWAVATPTSWLSKKAQRVFLAIEPVIMVPPLFENVRAERLHIDIQFGGRRYSDPPVFWKSPLRWKITQIVTKLVKELTKALFPE